MNQKNIVNWMERVYYEAKRWGHFIYKVTGDPPSRRSYVLWMCTNHPNGGTNIFSYSDVQLNKLLNDPKISFTKEDMDSLIRLYPGQQFYASRMEYYTKSYEKSLRTECCREKLFGGRKIDGYTIFVKLLQDRGKHYKTKYTLLIGPDQYNGRYVKYPIKCESHNQVFHYSMHALNCNTSCPCPDCRNDPNHKNVAVPIIQRRNGGRDGQIIRHAKRVKAKYGSVCFVSGSTFELQHHHLDGQDFYSMTQLEWNHNGLCLCGIVHRDYHNVFLKTVSVIAKEYANYTSDEPDVPMVADSNHLNDPDFSNEGAEVSRYTFLEYLRFLIFNAQVARNGYVDRLNAKLEKEYGSLNKGSGTVGCITLDGLRKAIDRYSEEYVGDNWALANDSSIPFANDPSLWAKVYASWQ